MDSESTIFLLLSILAGFGRFAAFALDPTLGPKPARPGPGERRRSLTVRALVELNHFFEHSFGPVFPKPYLSLRTTGVKFAKVFALSAFMILGVFIFSHALSETAWRVPVDGTVGETAQTGRRLLAIGMCLFALIFVNALMDLGSLVIVRFWLRPFEYRAKTPPPADIPPARELLLPEGHDPRHRPQFKGLFWRLLALPVFVLGIYVCFMTTMNAAFSSILTIRGFVAGYEFSWSELWALHAQLWWNETLPHFIDPIHEGRAVAVGSAHLLMFCVTPLIPALFVVVAVAAGAVLDLIDCAAPGSVSRVLDREDGHGHGHIRTAIVILALLGGAAAVVLSGGG